MDNALNAKVAEALGAVWCQEPLDSAGRAINAGHPYLTWPDTCFNFKGRTRIATPPNAADLYDGPEYDTDWNETGPLIERNRICVKWSPDCWWADREDIYLPGEAGRGATPLVAVCNLLLALTAAGKLEPQLAPVPLSR